MRRWYGVAPWQYRLVEKKGAEQRIASLAGNFIVKPSCHGKGCFTAQFLPAKTLVGIYPGVITNERQLGIKLAQMPFEQQQKVFQYLVHSRLHSTEKSKCYLDPTNKQGSIDESFALNYVLYINEPSKGQTINVQHVWNYDNDRLEIWTLRDIQQGEELLITYGASYCRDYSVATRNAQTCVFRDGTLQWEDE